MGSLPLWSFVNALVGNFFPWLAFGCCGRSRLRSVEGCRK